MSPFFNHVVREFLFYEDRSLKPSPNYLYLHRKCDKANIKTRWYGVSNKHGLWQQLKGRRRREEKIDFVSLTGRGPRPGRPQLRYVRHIRPSQLNLSRRYTYLARCGERARSSRRWSCSPLSSKVSNFVTLRSHARTCTLDYYSIDDNHRWEVDRGGPVLEKIMRARPLCHREIIYLVYRRCSLLSCSVRIQRETKSGART